LESGRVESIVARTRVGPSMISFVRIRAL
jgi:hypothetical protein